VDFNVDLGQRRAMKNCSSDLINEESGAKSKRLGRKFASLQQRPKETFTRDIFLLRNGSNGIKRAYDVACSGPYRLFGINVLACI
jgi:hypothetical protein